MVLQAIVSLADVYAKNPSAEPPPSSADIVFAALATMTEPLAAAVSPVPPLPIGIAVVADTVVKAPAAGVVPPTTPSNVPPLISAVVATRDAAVVTPAALTA